MMGLHTSDEMNEQTEPEQTTKTVARKSFPPKYSTSDDCETIVIKESRIRQLDAHLLQVSSSNSRQDLVEISLKSRLKLFIGSRSLPKLDRGEAEEIVRE